MSEDCWKARNVNLNLFCHPFGTNMTIINNGELDSEVPETNLKDICTILYRSPHGVFILLSKEIALYFEINQKELEDLIYNIIKKYISMTDDEAHMATYPNDVKVDDFED